MQPWLRYPDDDDISSSDQGYEPLYVRIQYVGARHIDSMLTRGSEARLAPKKAVRGLGDYSRAFEYQLPP